MTSIEEELVPKLRRAVGDNEEPYEYQDSILEEYIMDSLGEIQLIWEHDYTVIEENDSYYIEPEPKVFEQHLFILNAQIMMQNSRPNLNFSVGDLSVRRIGALDNTDKLEAKLKKAINKVKGEEALGSVLTEYDTYESRLEDWLERLIY